MGLAAIGVSLEREISKCFNLFETPRLLIVRSVDSTCPSRSSYRPSRSTFSFYRPLSSLRLLSLSNYTFLFPFKRSSCSFLHFIHFSGFFFRNEQVFDYIWTVLRNSCCFFNPSLYFIPLLIYVLALYQPFFSEWIACLFSLLFVSCIFLSLLFNLVMVFDRCNSPKFLCFKNTEREGRFLLC